MGLAAAVHDEVVGEVRGLDDETLQPRDVRADLADRHGEAPERAGAVDHAHPHVNGVGGGRGRRHRHSSKATVGRASDAGLQIRDESEAR